MDFLFLSQTALLDVYKRQLGGQIIHLEMMGRIR